MGVLLAWISPHDWTGWCILRPAPITPADLCLAQSRKLLDAFISCHVQHTVPPGQSLHSQDGTDSSIRSVCCGGFIHSPWRADFLWHVCVKCVLLYHCCFFKLPFMDNTQRTELSLSSDWTNIYHIYTQVTTELKYILQLWSSTIQKQKNWKISLFFKCGSGEAARLDPDLDLTH